MDNRVWLDKIEIALCYKNKWLYKKGKDGVLSLPSGVLTRGEKIVESARRILWEQIGVASGKIFFAGEDAASGTALFYAEASCIGKREKPFDYEIVEREKPEKFFTDKKFSPERPSLIFEKVCGAVVYKMESGVRKYLIIRNLSGHIGFPKGHMEAGETERETAWREVREETGLSAVLNPSFRHEYRFTVLNKRDILEKNAVYFLAEYHDEPIIIQKSEVPEYWLLPYKEAAAKINHKNDILLLELAEKEAEKIKN